MNNIIVYKQNVIISSLTGNTSDFSNSAITSGIFIPGGAYLDINQFDKQTISRLDIINNIISYIDDGTSKYDLDILIVNSTNEFSSITQTDDYCIQISYNNQVIDYLMMKVVTDLNYMSYTTTQQTTQNTSITSIVVENKSPIIYYNLPISGTSWDGGNLITPYNVFLYINHSDFTYYSKNNIVEIVDNKIYVPYFNDIKEESNSVDVNDIRNINPSNLYGVSVVDYPSETPTTTTTTTISNYKTINSGWTLDSLKYLFIDHVVDSYGFNVPISMLNFTLYDKGSIISLNDINKYGIYDIKISYTDIFGNVINNKITDISVNDLTPDIVYKPYILTRELTGTTNSYSGATSKIEPNITIVSGFTLNLNGFDKNIIYRNDIIDNIVNYVKDIVDVNINKYMIDIIVSGKHNDNGPIVYTDITKPGDYCVKVSLKNNNNNEIINYFMMKVVYDLSLFSDGYWQDNKVWVDFVLWLDHPIVPKL
jgi:hypothetical protein